jgi:superfamily II DNA or RNA helicase
MATGLGKTVVMSKVANEWTRGNVLCLAHRIELVDQMADTLAGELGFRPVVEQGPRGIDPDSLFAEGSIVVGSIQSMISEKRLRKFAGHPFGLLIIDECHRATAPSYQKLIDRLAKMNKDLRILGVTATPNRTDGTAMGLIFQTVAFEMGIVPGIDAGWLVDIHQKFAVVEDLDLSKISCKRNEFGEMDFKASELEAFLSQEGPLHAMSRPVLDCTTKGEQAIIFASSVKHAHLWAAVLNHYRPGCAAAIDGTMPKGQGCERTETVERFKAGELQFLLNMNICTEDFDAPKTAFVIMGRPTKSPLVYTQMLGRATRPLPGVVDGLATAEERKDAIAASTKPFATVLDFVGNSSQHQVITATDILGGTYDVDIRNAADRIIGARASANVRDALVKAQASMLLEAEEAKRRPMRTVVQGVNLQYTLGDVSPFSGTAPASAPQGARGTLSDGQLRALRDMGVAENTALTYGRKQAGAVLKGMRRSRCSLNQAKTLRKFGFDPMQFNFSGAHDQIQAIADNGWRWP